MEFTKSSEVISSVTTDPILCQEDAEQIIVKVRFFANINHKKSRQCMVIPPFKASSGRFFIADTYQADSILSSSFQAKVRVVPHIPFAYLRWVKLDNSSQINPLMDPFKVQNGLEYPNFSTNLFTITQMR